MLSKTALALGSLSVIVSGDVPAKWPRCACWLWWMLQGHASVVTVTWTHQGYWRRWTSHPSLSMSSITIMGSQRDSIRLWMRPISETSLAWELENGWCDHSGRIPKHIERCGTSSRRFKVTIEELRGRQQTILQGLKATYEKHHRVQITDEAGETAVKMAHRY